MVVVEGPDKGGTVFCSWIHPTTGLQRGYFSPVELEVITGEDPQALA
jgi:hypothetical protein